ncbi:MAG: HAD family phosphatase [Spirochaetes bacterium]|nr:HAD family phosphatase [Spirochaetota bacterium]
MRTVIFDWGGVVIDNPTPGFLAHFSGLCNVPEDTFAAFYARHEFRFQTGAIREHELWIFAHRELGVPLPDAGTSRWKDALRSVFKDKPEMIALIHDLKQQSVFTMLLTNTEVPTREFYHERQYPFDDAVFSCDEGLAKPDPEIYRRALARHNTRPEDTAFIDDKPENVASANALGIHGIVCRSTEQVRNELLQWMASS